MGEAGRGHFREGATTYERIAKPQGPISETGVVRASMGADAAVGAGGVGAAAGAVAAAGREEPGISEDAVFTDCAAGIGTRAGRAVASAVALGRAMRVVRTSAVHGRAE